MINSVAIRVQLELETEYDDTSFNGSAVCADHVMNAGRHYVELLDLSVTANLSVGVVRAGCEEKFPQEKPDFYICRDSSAWMVDADFC